MNKNLGCLGLFHNTIYYILQPSNWQSVSYNPVPDISTAKYFVFVSLAEIDPKEAMVAYFICTFPVKRASSEIYISSSFSYSSEELNVLSQGKVNIL